MKATEVSNERKPEKEINISEGIRITTSDGQEYKLTFGESGIRICKTGGLIGLTISPEAVNACSIT